MTLGVLRPLLLVGLIGVLLPLLLHLLRQRRPRITPFPALALLLLARQRRARRRRLRDILLLLTRTGLLAVLVLVLAGPYCTTLVSVPAEAARDQAAVVVLDDTFSMRWRRGSTTLFAAARQRAAALLDVFPPSAPVALLTVTGQGPQVEELSLDRRRLRRAVRKSRATHRGGDVVAALGRAQRLLQGGPAGKPRAIYVITDGTASGWSTPRPPLPNDSALRVLDVAKGKLANRAVVALQRTRSGRAYRIGLRNATLRSEKLTVRLEAASRVIGRATVRVPSRATHHVTVKVDHRTLARKVQFLRARITGDRLPEDDERVVAVGRPPRIRVLLVDGDPRDARHADELFYLEAALRASAGKARGLEVSTVAAEDLAAVDLARLDVVALCNVATLDRRTTQRLVQFVDGGGGLLVTLGAQVDLENYNLVAGAGLLPARLRSVRRTTARGASSRIVLGAARGELARVLEEPATRTALARSRVDRHVLASCAGSRCSALLRLTDGPALLLERRLGSGRVLLLTTSIDREWTDLPLGPAFVPLVQALVHRLGGRSSELERRTVPVGQAVVLRPAAGDRFLLVRDPSGGIHTVAVAIASGATRFSATELPGGYRVFAQRPGGQTAERPGSAFAVTLDPRESDLKRLKRLPEQPGRLGRPGGKRRAAALRRDLTGWLALLALLLLLGEALLAARFGRWRHARLTASGRSAGR